MNQNPIFVLAVLFSIIFLAELLVKKTWLRPLGTAMIVIILGAIFSNIGIIPTASNSIPLYDLIFTYLVPVALFILLLEVDLKGLKKAGLPMMGMFVVGAIGTSIGALIAIQLIGNIEVFGEARSAIAGMFTGTYIGGSINFNAVALHYGILENAELYAGSVAIDNIVTTIWMLVCIGIPILLNRIVPREVLVDQKDFEDSTYVHEERAELSTTGIALLITMALFALICSQVLAELLAQVGWNIPFILILSTIALILAQFAFVSKIKGKQLIGILLLYLFLAVIGAYCEFSVLGAMGETAVYLLLFASILVLIHGIVIFSVGALLKLDWSLISIASQANVGGQATAISLAKNFKRDELLVPAVLVGSFGNALGTYLGFLVASLA